MKNDKKEDIPSHVREVVRDLYNQYVKEDSENVVPEITMFKVNNNLNFNIKVENCECSQKHRKFTPFITCQKTSLDAEMIVTPSNTFVSNNAVDSIFPEYINYYNEPLKLEIYTMNHVYNSNIPPPNIIGDRKWFT